MLSCLDCRDRSDRKVYLFLRSEGVLEGMESRTHLNMRPQIRHIVRLGLEKAIGNSWGGRRRVDVEVPIVLGSRDSVLAGSRNAPPHCSPICRALLPPQAFLSSTCRSVHKVPTINHQKFHFHRRQDIRSDNGVYSADAG
jgi:hypothetical protein